MFGLGSKAPLPDFSDLQLGYYRVLFTMCDIPEDDHHDDHSDLFRRTPSGWLCYNGHGEWGKLSERRFAKDVRDGIREYPQRIDGAQVEQMMHLADQDD